MSQLVYRKDIDGLRGFAIVLVLFFHYFPGIAPIGFLGVDIFFVISGYLITRIIQDNWQRENFFSWFYLRRIRRLFPSLIVVSYIILLLGVLFLFSLEFENLLRHLSAAATFTSNILIGSEISYFKPDSSKKPLLHLWSLAVEEQFYLFWPLIIFAALKNRLKPVFPILLLILASFVYYWFEFKFYSMTSFYSTFTRGWELLLGCLISQIHLKRPIKFLSWIGASLLLLGVTDLYQFSGVFILPPVVVGTALIILDGPGSWINHKILSHPLLVWIGLISYPVYLWHWPLLSFTRIVFEQNPNTYIRASLLLLSIFLGWLTTKFVESPIRRMDLRLRSGLALASPLLLLFLIGAPLQWKMFREARTSAGHAPKLQGIQGEALNKMCETTSDFIDLKCELYDPTRLPTVVIFGDSLGDHHYPGFSQVLAQRGENVLNLSRLGCVPVLGFKNTGKFPGVCNSVVEPAIKYILDEPSIHTVYYSHRFVPRNAELKENPKPTYLENYEIALKLTLETLLKTKKVTFIYGHPELDYQVTTCLNTKLALGRTGRDCRLELKKYKEKFKTFIPVHERVFKTLPQLTILRLEQYLCDDQYCHFTHENELLFRDGYHLNASGSRFIAKKYFTELKESP